MYLSLVVLSIIGLFLWLFVSYRLWSSRPWEYETDFQGPSPDSGPGISIIIPVRNEANNLKKCLPTILDQKYAPFEVIVVNDRSTDRSLEILNSFDSDRLTVIDGEPRPGSDWQGKTWALHQGVQEASYDWYLFVDADMAFQSGLLGYVSGVGCSDTNRLYSLLPHSDLPGGFNRFLLPWHGLSILLMFPLARVNDEEDPIALAAGGFILIHSDLYERVDGHRSVRGAIAEDLALANTVKRNGAKISLTSCDLLSSTLYDTPPETINGVAKHFLAAPWHPLLIIPIGVLLFVLGTIVPLLALPFLGLSAVPVAAPLILSLVIIHSIALGMYNSMRLSPLWALTAVPALTVYSGVGIYAVAQYLVYGGPIWKNRTAQRHE